MAVPVRADLIAQVFDCQRRLAGSAGRMIQERRNRVDGLARGLGDPHSLLEGCIQRLDDRAERLGMAMTGALDRRRTRVAELAAKLRHPREVLTSAQGRLQSEARALGAGLRQVVAAEEGRLARVGSRLTLMPIRIRVSEGDRRLTDLSERMDAGYARLLTERSSRLRSGAALLESYSYRGILERGFALVTDQDDQRITSAADAKAGTPVTVEFHDGKVDAIVGHGGVVRKPEAGGGGKPKKSAPKAGQGVLF